MGRTIVKLKDHYIVWSSIVDAPIFVCDSVIALGRFMEREHSQLGLDFVGKRIERVDRLGTSDLHDTSAAESIWLNRAGPDESTLTIEGIYRHYCLREPMRDEWIVSGRVMGDDDAPTYDDVVKGWD